MTVTVGSLVTDEGPVVDIGKKELVLEKNEKYALPRAAASVLWKRTCTANASIPPRLPTVELPSWLADDHSTVGNDK